MSLRTPPEDRTISEVQVKICGLDRPESVEAAVSAGADYVGFVFYPPSPRNLKPRSAAGLISAVPGGVCRVGLFVDPSDADLERVLEAVRLDLLQLHGDETPERVARIKDMTGLPAMKVIRVSSAEDLAPVDKYAGVADRILFDAKPPAEMAHALPGGNALAFEWDLLTELRLDIPWMLAGGLTPENVGQAVTITGARAVDISSGVEDRPGHKNIDKIHRFVAAVRVL